MKLRRAESQLRAIKRALPPLPTADELYEKIVNYCLEFYDCTREVSPLEQSFNNLRISHEPLDSRIHTAQHLESRAHLLQLRLVFVRTQLRTLFTLPPVMVAMDQMKEEEWDTLINRRHKTIHNESFVVRLDVIATAAADQLQAISSLLSALSSVRSAYQDEKKEEDKTFREEILSTMRHNHQILVEHLEEIQRTFPRYGGQLLPSSEQSEADARQRESSIIEENAEFAEEESGEEDCEDCEDCRAEEKRVREIEQLGEKIQDAVAKRIELEAEMKRLDNIPTCPSRSYQ
ncbi:hypothetical protein COOONC_24162 [Cooperia oncophora]